MNGRSATTAAYTSVNPSPGWLYAVLSLPNFRLPRSWTLSLSAAARRTTPAASAACADSILVIAVGAIDGARAIGADDDVGGRRRSELRGRRLIAGLLRAAAGGCLRRAFSLEFQASEFQVFIPWRWGPTNPAGGGGAIGMVR